MVVLKKIRAGTLVETMIASVIIIVVFLIASLSLNNVFKGAIKADDSALENRIKEVIYFTKNEKLIIPFYEDNQFWELAIEKMNNQIILEVLNKKNLKEKQVVVRNEAP